MKLMLLSVRDKGARGGGIHGHVLRTSAILRRYLVLALLSWNLQHYFVRFAMIFTQKRRCEIKFNMTKNEADKPPMHLYKHSKLPLS